MEQNKHILIIDDHPEISDLVTDTLAPMGYQITAVDHISNIIETVKKNKPDLVILDYILEGINGGEYCAQIKRNIETKDIPVMILSGYPKVLASLGDYGADMIVNKPFDAENLCQRVAHLLNEHIWQKNEMSE